MSPFSYEEMASAAFDNDSLAGEGVGMAAVLGAVGMDKQTFCQAAEQRAMRAIIVNRDPKESKRVTKQAMEGEWTIEDLTPAERLKLVEYVMLWIDGALTVVRAMKDKTDD